MAKVVIVAQREFALCAIVRPPSAYAGDGAAVGIDASALTWNRTSKFWTETIPHELALIVLCLIVLWDINERLSTRPESLAITEIWI
jgi:hypothetical protein